MMLLACMFALGFATGIGVGAWQAAVIIYKPTKKELPHD